MKSLRYVFAALLILASLTIIGCKSKQDPAGVGKGAPQSAAGAPGSKEKTGVPVASAQEQAEARAAAVKALARFESGDFSSLYKEASSGFQALGSESQFVAKFQQTRQKIGVLKNPKETSFETLPNKSHVLVYRISNDQYDTDIRLTFSRAKNGKLELAGLNQHDELKN